MKKNCVSIAFTGDIGFDKYMDGKWEDAQLLSEEILDFFKSADHVVANVEGAVMHTELDPSRGAFFHTMSPEAVRVLDKIGADFWCIANNHTMDAGEQGLVSTLEYAKKSGARAFGAGINEAAASEPAYIEGAGGIGIIAVGYMDGCVGATATAPGVFRWDDFDAIGRRISEIKEKCRWCVLISHGGEEFAPMPIPYTRERYMKYLDLGADAVVGHHPHVPENYELFDNGKAIFYSLGNFIFDTNYQREHLYTDRGVLLKLIFAEDKMSFEAIGTEIVRGEERIRSAPLSAIFENVSAEEFARIAPLACKAFIAEDRKTMIYLYGDKYKNATEEVWRDYIYGNKSEGYIKEEHMDMAYAARCAEKSDSGEWESSPLKGVVEHIINLIPQERK